MPNKKVIFAALAAALLFGVVTAGCNRNREPRMASAERRRPGKSRSDLEPGSSHRPAEVLSASVRRPSRNGTPRSFDSRPAPDASYGGGHMARLPRLPDAAPGSHYQQPVYAGAPYYADSPQVAVGQIYYGEANLPTYPGYNEPIEVIHPTPELAMAKARLQSPPLVAPAAYTQQPAPTRPVQGYQPRPAPIPELEPVRYQRVAAGQNFEPLMPLPEPVPVMMTRAEQANRHGQQRVIPQTDAQRALAPLPQQSINPGQGWVSSPSTAMRPQFR